MLGCDVEHVAFGFLAGMLLVIAAGPRPRPVRMTAFVCGGLTVAVVWALLISWQGGVPRDPAPARCDALRGRRTVTQTWCSCGSLEGLVDANGNRTTWERDLQGRVTKEIRADGRQTLYTYETTTSRLKPVTDPKNQVTTYHYAADDRLTSLVFTNEETATPDVSFTYDPVYGRLATMTDGTGLTTYGYHAVGVPGATRLASVDGPLTNDTITYGSDELGRVTTRTVNGVGVTWTPQSTRGRERGNTPIGVRLRSGRPGRSYARRRCGHLRDGAGGVVGGAWRHRLVG